MEMEYFSLSSIQLVPEYLGNTMVKSDTIDIRKERTSNKMQGSYRYSWASRYRPLMDKKFVQLRTFFPTSPELHTWMKSCDLVTIKWGRDYQILVKVGGKVFSAKIFFFCPPRHLRVIKLSTGQQLLLEEFTWCSPSGISPRVRAISSIHRHEAPFKKLLIKYRPILQIAVGAPPPYVCVCLSVLIQARTFQSIIPSICTHFHIWELRCLSTMTLSAHRIWFHRLSNT